MDFRFAGEQDIDFNHSGDVVSFSYMHYRAESPAKCDLSFRKFITTSVFNGAILIPVRSGQGRKLTSEGVVKIAANSAMPTTTCYMDTVLFWTPISEFIFERYRKESATKIYFRGFPLEASQAQIVNLFSEFGPLQYLYIMCDSSYKKRTNRQGYVIFESRASVDRLFSQKATLNFYGFQIYFEEYKSKNASLMQGFLAQASSQALGCQPTSEVRAVTNPLQPVESCASRTQRPLYEHSVTCGQSPYFTAQTRDTSNVNSLTVIRTGAFKKAAFASCTNIEKPNPIEKIQRRHLRFGTFVEANCNRNNLRINKRTRGPAPFARQP